MSEGFALPAGARPGPNCGVTAVAVAAGCPFEDAWRVMSAGKRGNWKGRTTHNERLAALRWFGVRFRPINFLFRETLVSFVRRRAEPGRLYYVWTTGHVQMVRDGVVLDQLGPKPIHAFWGRRKLIRSVLLIEEGAR